MHKELIYIVEDDANIREIMQYALKNSGYQTDLKTAGIFWPVSGQKPQETARI